MIIRIECVSGVKNILTDRVRHHIGTIAAMMIYTGGAHFF